MPTDYDFRDPEEYDRVVRVRGKEGGIEEGSWFWEDEEMAERLARCLRPRQELRNEVLPPRKEELKDQEKKKDTSSGFWGRKKSVTKSPRVEERRDLKGTGVNDGERGNGIGDRVVFDVKAEEVCFRTENAFGIYETERGFGIVLNLRVVLARR